jgi:phosphoserine phosphatase RsbU/P
MKSISDILILFVDDECDTISGLKRFFRRSGFRKVFAQSGAEALDIMDHESVDILVTDALMPNMGGCELIRTAKSRYPDIMCILITGANEVEQIVKSVDTGTILDYLSKPIDPDVFRNIIDKAVASVGDLSQG